MDGLHEITLLGNAIYSLDGRISFFFKADYYVCGV